MQEDYKQGRDPIMAQSISEEISKIVGNLDQANISFKDKQVLVTGGAGFLGSWTCDVLVAQGARVVCIDNFASGQQENIASLLEKENFRFIRHDISTPIQLEEQFNVVMHLASRASPLEFTKHPIQILKSNTLGVWIALGIAKRDKARFLFTSTSEIYGDPTGDNIPTKEDYNGNVNPIGLRGCYDEAKRCGEAFIFAYHRQHGLDTRVVRIFNTYGPRLRAGDTYGRSVSRFVDQALKQEPITVFGDGTQTRSFLYVSDQVEGLLKAVGIPDLPGQVINIGSQDEIQIIELACLIKKLTNSPSPIEYLPLPSGDPRRRCPDITKAIQLLNWRPYIKLEDGLAKTIEWYRQI